MARKARTSTNLTRGMDEATSRASAEVTDTTAAASDTLISHSAPAEGRGANGEASPPSPEPQAPSSKVGRIRAMLASPAGSSLAALCEATGWQSHSVRAALTGLRKAGSTIEKSKAEDGSTVYRIAAGAEGGE